MINPFISSFHRNQSDSLVVIKLLNVQRGGCYETLFIL